MKIRTNNKVCILCLDKPPIENSHIVPKLVLKWILDNAPVEHLRWSSIPNKPFQDGWKADYFCTECEERLAGVENQFKTDFFDPIVTGKAATIDYVEFLLPFSLSLYFRHLKFSLDQDPAYKSKGGFLALLERLRSALLTFLFKGAFPDIYSYVVYLPFVNQSSFFEPGVNQYILTVDGLWFDYHIPPDKVFLVGGVKLPKLQFIFSEQPLETVARDEEGKVELSHARIERSGTFKICNVPRVILPGLLGEHYNCRAMGLRETTKNLSERQAQKVVDEIASHSSPESTIFHEAYEHDLRLAAFKEKR